MKEVLLQSATSTVCQTLSCGPGEMAVVKRFARYGSTDPCECVPDVWENENEKSDRLGESLAVGDFDNDGFKDLAVGAPGEGGNVGALYVFRGSQYGLRFWKRISQYFLTAINYRNGQSFAPGQQAGDEFAFSLAAGDVNGDGYDELLVGTPGRASDAGVVYILPGTAQGPDSQHAQWLDQGESGGAVEAGDRFGASLVVANWNGDAFADFAIGAPAEVYEGHSAGVVSVHRGRFAAVGAGTFEYGDGILHQGLGGLVNEDGDEFGFALAAGDIDVDGRDELVVGGPGENNDNGWVFLFEKEAVWTMSGNMSKTSARFGAAIAVGDFISDAYMDLAVGAPSHSSSKGAVFTFRGSSSGMTYAQSIVADEIGDQFGAALAVGQAGQGKDDLIVGVPGERFGAGPAEGVVAVYSGVTTTVLGTPYRLLDQYAFFDGGANDVVVPPEHHGLDGMGKAIVMLPILGTNTQAIVAGAPTDTVDTVQSGAVFVYAPGLVADRKLDQVSMRHGEALLGQ